MYHYGAWQNSFTEVEASDSRFEFVEGLPAHNDLPSGTTHTVMVIDDLMEEVSKSKTAMDIFTKHSHHRNMKELFLMQKLYCCTHNTRFMSQNAHIKVLFKNPRDASSVKKLGRQMYPGNHKFLYNATKAQGTGLSLRSAIRRTQKQQMSAKNKLRTLLSPVKTGKKGKKNTRRKQQRSQSM